MFNTPEMASEMNENNPHVKSRVIQAKEVRIVRNNKPVLHMKQFSDSAHPEKNKSIVLKAKNANADKEEAEMEEETN